MRPTVLQPILRTRRFTLATVPGCRSFSESVAPAVSEKPRGVPLAFDLDGINIRQSPQPKTTPRRTLAQLLVSRLRNASHADISSITRGAQRRATQPPAGSSPRQERTHDAPSNRPSRDGIQATARPPKQRVPGSTSQPKPNGAERVAGSRPTGADDQGVRAQGQRRGYGQAGNSNGPPRKRKAKIQRRPRDRDYNGSSPQNPVNEEYVSGHRSFDAKGVLKLEEAGVVPTLEVPRMSSLNSIFGDSPTSNTPTSQGMLEVKTYFHHGPPGITGHSVLGVVDNAQLAMSHVRDLDVPHRREVLAIVTRLASTAKPVVGEKRV